MKKIVCFGLGKIGECTISRYQLALLLCFKELYEAEAQVYDPVFCQSEIEVLRESGCVVLGENSEGKYRVKDGETTLFFLPHCPLSLSNNLLWANWGLQLSRCVVIANSFTDLLERKPSRYMNEFARYISNISPYVTELPIINNFKFYEVFHDTAIHVFPPKAITLISKDFWCDRSEPNYPDDEADFIANTNRC